MSSIIGVERISFEHGGRFDTGFWTGASIEVVTENQMKSYKLSEDDAEDLEYVILKWLKKKKKFGRVVKL